ncbi:MAG: Xaa-Pro peptidase family protein [Dehalococcoidia bacterium]
MAIPVDLPFPKEEYQQRLSAVQERMKARDLDALLCYTPENIYYLTGYSTTGYYVYQCLIVPAEHDPIMVTRELETPNVLYGTWLDYYRTFKDTEDPVETTCKAVVEFGLDGKRVGFETTSWFLVQRDYEKTVSLLPKAKIGDGANLVEEGRVVKSPREIECMRRGGEIVVKGMEAGIGATRAGATENDVAAEVTRALIANGSLYFAGQPYVCSGPRTAIGHATWSGRKLEAGDPIFFEMSANVKRYSTALMRTVNLGRPDDEYERLADASLAGLNAAIGAIKPGATSGEVDNACRGAITKAGFGPQFHHRTGYSIGLGFPPGWGEGHIYDLKAGDPRVLKTGMTFHLVPVLFVDGRYGVGFSETVLVTEAGCEPLSSYPRGFIII